ncbi:hypothetical protein LDENG_00158620 [Lucifuga dentata]|nr:hypothetical protein LDENG_00158620 [Lucifuga dentata]
MVNQMSGVSNINLPLRSNVPNQGTLNAQMLAQRQREYLSNHLRQRQQQQQQHMHQQRAMMMRAQGINMPPNVPSGGAASTPVPMGGTNPRLPQGSPQQFPYPASSYGTSQQQQHQDPVSGFPCGAATPQSPLLSPRMGRGQSPMLQQGQGQPQTQGANQGASSYQTNTDLSGWPQAVSISTSTSMYSQQSQSQYATQPNGGMYNSNSSNMNVGVAMSSNGGNMSQMSGQMGSMTSMATDQVSDGSLILEQLAGIDVLTQESEATSNYC